MSNDQQNSPANQPPITTNELHHQPPSSTTGINHLSGYTTIRLPQSPITPIANNNNSNTSAVETNNSTPESRLAAAIGQAIFNIPSTSFQDVITATIGPLIRTISDADSSVTQDPLITTNATPPKITTNSPLRRAVSDAITTINKKTTTKKPLRRALSDSAEYQQRRQKIRTPPTTKVSSSPTTASQSSARSEKVKDIMREFEQRFSEIICDKETAVEDNNTNPNPPQHQKEQEECVGVERLMNGDLKFELSCCCGKRFEMLIKPNGYCFYRLT